MRCERLTSGRQSPVALLLFAALVLAGAPVAAENRSVRISTQTVGDTIGLTAHLTNVLDATMTLTVQMENLSSADSMPLTIDSDGKTEVPLTTLRVVDRSRPYKFGYKFTWKPGGRRSGAAPPFVYALPYRDERHRVRQGFLGRFSHYEGSQDEYAIDWSMPVGTLVLAARAGTVVALRSDVMGGGKDPKYKSDYNFIVIRHEDRTYAEYVHLDTEGVLVKLGEKVEQGQPICRSGNTGYTSEPHLHFAVFNTISGSLRKTVPVQFRVGASGAATLQQGRTY